MESGYRQLLVHMDSTPRSHARLGLARRIAAENGADVSALYASTPGIVSLAASPDAMAAAVQSLLAFDDELRVGARAAFDRAMKEPGAAASWSEADELPVTGTFVQQALHADLVILGQHAPPPGDTAHVPADFVQTVVEASGRPVLVVPYIGAGDRCGDTVLVAWNETRESARALAGALPLVRKASRVHVVRWGPDTRPEVRGHGLDLRRYLLAHDVQAMFHEFGAEPRDIGELLLSTAADLDADLLVMGCYGHSRAREWILGGASRTVLHSMTLPVLMAH